MRTMLLWLTPGGLLVRFVVVFDTLPPQIHRNSRDYRLARAGRCRTVNSYIYFAKYKYRYIVYRLGVETKDPRMPLKGLKGTWLPSRGRTWIKKTEIDEKGNDSILIIVLQKWPLFVKALHRLWNVSIQTLSWVFGPCMGRPLRWCP